METTVTVVVRNHFGKQGQTCFEEESFSSDFSASLSDELELLDFRLDLDSFSRSLTFRS